MKWLIFALLGCAFCSGRARAEDTVILFESAGAHPGLCAALRIQLTDLAIVRCEPAEPVPLERRVAEAALAVAKAGARLGVLLAESGSEDPLHLLVVGSAADRALLAVEPVEARPEPDVDRALALKVRETFEVSMLAARAGAARIPVITPAARPSNAVLVELGAAAQTDARFLGLIAAGIRHQWARHYGELALGGWRTSSATSRRAGGSTREDEWTLGLSGRAGWRHGRYAFGPTASLSVARASVRGETADGHDGRAQLAFARMSLGWEVRWLLWNGPSPVQLRLAPALELDPVRQRFTLDGRTALDLGRLRAVFPLSLVFGLPWGDG
ncbi:MAG TPA: hypothetical protein VI299_29850 [Polyangiales bacterium]